jgi:hypothetical protein
MFFPQWTSEECGRNERNQLDRLQQSDILDYNFRETAKEVISRAALKINFTI